MKKVLAMIILATFSMSLMAKVSLGEEQGIPNGKCTKTAASLERNSYGESSAQAVSEGVKPMQVTSK